MPVRGLRLIHSPTPDWEAVRAFYRDVLGLEETGGWERPGDRGSFLAAGSAELELMEVDAASIGVLPKNPGGWSLALEVDDLEAEFSRLSALGAAVSARIEERPWGSRDFLVRDPAGNLVLLFRYSDA
jgi:catechol 2,3-dioxygenase-like lactoylglutathione lyase family enzyme